MDAEVPCGLAEGWRSQYNFFHAKAIWRCHENRINKLGDTQGNIYNDSKEMGQAVTSYFKNIFLVDDTLDATPVIDLFSPIVGQETNEALCAEFIDKEIVDALF